MKAVLWNYRYPDMKKSWAKQMVWLSNSLKKYGVEVKNRGILCDGLNVDPYDCKIDNPSDICVYNHIDISDLVGNVLRVKKNWFFKPTVPDEVHTTLDELGYGPYSSISFDRPDFESVTIDPAFPEKVKGWIEKGTNKWSRAFQVEKIEKKDYWLVLGQCGGDSVNTRHDFGDYFTKLRQAVRELARVSNDDIIVKLHPYTDGKDATDTVFSDRLKKELEAIDPSVEVYSGKLGIHSFLPNCKAVILGNSGAGFEAMMHKKPIIAWGKPEYHWIAYDLRYLSDLIRAIKLDWFDSAKQDKFLFWYLERYCFYDQETCDNRVKQLLRNL